MTIVGFLKHVYSYFGNENQGGTMNNHPTRNSIEDRSIHMIDSNGRLIKYIPCPGDENPKVETSQSNGTDREEILYKRGPDGQFTPVPSTFARPSNSLNTKTHPIRNQSLSVKPSPLNSESSTINWDYWPDGPIEQHFTFEEYKATTNLLSHWAYKTNGGDRYRFDNAETWQKGKRSTRDCLGIISCDNPTCAIIIRPNTKPEALYSQVQNSCRCGARLSQELCSVRSVIRTWSGGKHFTNEGYHSHRRPTHILHLSSNERTRFEALVASHPNSGPLQLIVGVPGIEGPGESVADISDVLLNKHRVAMERQSFKKGATQGAEGVFNTFSEYCKKYPNFVLHSELGEEVVICVQTDFMRRQLVKERLDGPINGTVNDAAHGWWKDRNSLLIVSSTFCPDLLCWVPGVLTYSNGASGQHFKHHFLGLFKSIAMEADCQAIPLIDSMMAGVMDFSAAERDGFIQAFVVFWTSQPHDFRTPGDLVIAAKRLLKGCEEHFRAGVTRVSRISAAVHPDQAEDFKKRAMSLLRLPNSTEFKAHADLLIRDFPALTTWMEWWTRPSHASMLFESERRMDIEVWRSLPATTNAEESMHWLLYCAAGRNHMFQEGMHALFSVAAYFERQHSGIKILWGDAQPWQRKFLEIGRTKPTRAPDPVKKKRKRNDGRPPDTTKELVAPKRKGKKKVKATSLSPTPNPVLSDSEISGSDTEPEPPKKKKPKIDNSTHSAKAKSTTIAKFPVLAIPLTQTKTKTQVIEKRAIVPASANIPVYTNPWTNPALVPSYKWKSNSCWLDTSLQLLYTLMERSPSDFFMIFDGLPSDSLLAALYTVLCERKELVRDILEPSKGVTLLLARHRDNFRRLLKKKRASKATLTGYDSVFAWFSECVKREQVSDSYRSPAALEILTVTIQFCTGSKAIGGPHLQVQKSPSRTRYRQLQAQDHSTFRGSLEDYFANFVSLDKHPIPAYTSQASTDGKIQEKRAPCWRSHEGSTLCRGDLTELRDLVVSLPLVLMFEVANERISCQDTSIPLLVWDIPATLTACSELLPDDTTGAELVYDLVGLALTSTSGDHFIARYTSHGSIYTYDSLANNGNCIKDPADATLETHLAGKKPNLPQGFVVYEIVYALRGGIIAQDGFFNDRTQVLSTKFNVNFSTSTLHSLSSITYTSDDLTYLEPSARYWMKNPYVRPTLEYVSKSSKKIPYIETDPDGDGIESEDSGTSKIPIIDIDDLPDTRTIVPVKSGSRAVSPALSLADSLPDSLFSLNCRCGIIGDGNKYYLNDVHGEAIQCDQCKDWSHIACQRDGRASNIKEKTPFICDSCDALSLSLMRTKIPPRRKQPAGPKKPLQSRLMAGRGAIARHKDFWYPVRLIQKLDDGWRLQWWRENYYATPGIDVGQISIVAFADITDSLWKDRQGRRLIRLGKWLHSHEVQDSDDILADPGSIRFSKDIDAIMSPHEDILRALLVGSFDELEDETVPAKLWLEKKKKPVAQGLVPYSGLLSITERAQIYNWFEIKICNNDQTLRKHWICLIPIAHAFTLYIAHHLKSNTKFSGYTKEKLLNEAWIVQMTKSPSRKLEVDVNRDCLRYLEGEMFERSNRAGIAGHYQWGLDAGNHDNWDPYSGLPESLNFGDREGSESEMQIGPNYITDSEPPPLPVKRLIIRPRSLRIKK